MRKSQPLKRETGQLFNFRSLVVSLLARRGEREMRRAVADRNRNAGMADAGRALAPRILVGRFRQAVA